MAIIFIFIDGLGLGAENSSNPLYISRTPFLSWLLEGNSLTVEALKKEYQHASLLGLDANLGVPGLPQSATGQATLFTGVNAAALIGRHLNGYPNEKLRGLLAEKGMFLQLQQRGFHGTFANAYRPEFFDDLAQGLKKYFSCSTLITYYGGLKFRNLEDLRTGQAVYMDITNDYLQKLGFVIPRVSPEEAGKHLVNISRNYHLTLYEHFMTDIAGHSKDYRMAAKVIQTLDSFLEAVFKHMDYAQDLLFICSDHGNLENLSVKGHTRNLVPALIVGSKREKLASLLRGKKDLAGVLPSLLEVLSSERGACS